MKYNPDVHHRRSIRLKDYDYSQAGMYFVTLCCDKRKCRFGRIENGEMIMNEYGIIAQNEWIHLIERFTSIEMVAFQIMPNHMHGIVSIGDRVGATLAVAPNPDTPNPVTPNPVAQNPVAPNPVAQNPVGATLAVAQNPDVTAGVIRAGAGPSIGNIVGAYKSLVANACLKIYKSKRQTMGKLWQRNYWEHIIRNEQELTRIRNYIENNPIQWEYDKLNGGSGNRVSEPQLEYGEESWMV